MKITIRNLDEWGACDRRDGERFSDARLKRILRGRTSLALEEVFRLHLLDEDKIWIATRPGVMTRAQTRRWLELVVIRAVRTHALRCGTASVEAAWEVAEEAARGAAARAASVEAAWEERRRQMADLRGVLKKTMNG